MKLWNIFRNRAISSWLQKNEVNIIPNVSWGKEDSYGYCFEGVPQNATVAVSTNGCIRDKNDREMFKAGLREMITRLNPKTIVNYSYAPRDIGEEYLNHYDIIFLENYNITVRRKEVSHG